MKKIAELSQLDVITVQRFLVGFYKRKMELRDMPIRHIPKGISIKQLESYAAFAIACKEKRIEDVDFVKIKQLKAYKRNGEWVFKYILKTGIFSKKKFELEWCDEEGEY